MTAKKNITIAGAGVIGLWQAAVLARAGYSVRVLEAAVEPFASAASRWAGAMLAPDCESESAPDLVRDLGRQSLPLWRAVFDGVFERGTMVVAAARDAGELKRFARATQAHVTLGESEVGALEPDLAGRFATALHYPHEAHFDAIAGMKAVMAAAERAGARFHMASTVTAPGSGDDVFIDCRGLAARSDVKGLRGVRGERLLVQTNEVALSRAIRLLHPRQPIYVVPQGDGRFVVGATVIEREDGIRMTVRSALELLGSAYALHPAFAEAAILDMGAGVRPAFADNVPRVLVEQAGRVVRVNGAYRHGFLLAPVLAHAVADYLATGTSRHPLVLGV